MHICKHDTLIFDSSDHARDVGYKRATPIQRLAATLSPSKLPKDHAVEDVQASTFPAPLVLPGDELAYDPHYKRQDMDRTAVREAHGRRNKLYVVPAPTVTSEVDHVREWAKPQLMKAKAKKGSKKAKTVDEVVIPPPAAEDVRDYLAAFYHPVTTKVMDSPRLQFVSWDSTVPGSKSRRSRIGLDIGSETIGIRHRPSGDGVYCDQLNLNDMLDAAIAILPKDAFALVMLFDQDLYEDEKDDFCCGRAYGGSRVSIVSAARYNPLLDDFHVVEREHAWPASHCQAYVEVCCEIGGTTPVPRQTEPVSKSRSKNTPAALEVALQSFKSHSKPGYRARSSISTLQNLWFSRICKTASHELGHCFGMDHCVYYACVMQGTAGLSEDARQPPYLCPVDMAKVLRATGGNERLVYHAMLKFCGNWADKDGGEMWAALQAWLKIRLLELPPVVEVEMIDLT